MTEVEILDNLDNSNDGYYCSFVELGQINSYLIDTRLNVFVSDKNEWAIAVERLGYNPRADAIILDIHYYGNCLINLEYYNEKPTNWYSIYPSDTDKFSDTIENEVIKPDADFWLIRGQKVTLNHNKADYLKAGIKLKEYEQNEIRIEEVARLAILNHRDLFRASDNELYKSIPKNLNKILVLDEWCHKDFNIQVLPTMTDDELTSAFELNKNLGSYFKDKNLEDFIKLFRQQEIMLDIQSKKVWRKNRPSTFETWQQIANVIVTNAPTNYRPSKKPNTHWKYWKSSGSM